MKARKSKTEVTANIAKRLTELVQNDIDANKLNRTRVAKNIGVERSALAKYMSDDIEIGVNALTKIAKYYNVPTDYLLGLTDVKSTNQNEKSICEKTGLSEEALSTITTMCHDDSAVEWKYLLELENTIFPHYFDKFTGKIAFNEIMSDSILWRRIVEYLKKYFLLYVLKGGFYGLEEDNSYKTISNAQVAELQEKNALNYFVISDTFQKLVEAAAKRMCKKVKLYDSKTQTSSYIILPKEYNLDDGYSDIVDYDDDGNPMYFDENGKLVVGQSSDFDKRGYRKKERQGEGEDKNG